MLCRGQGSRTPRNVRNVLSAILMAVDVIHCEELDCSKVGKKIPKYLSMEASIEVFSSAFWGVKNINKSKLAHARENILEKYISTIFRT